MENKKIKICHVLSRFEVGGLENGVANLCNGHDRTRFEPFLCCVKGAGKMTERLKSDVRVDVLGAREGKDLFRFLRLAAYFRRTKPDIVHTHGWAQCSFDGIIGARLAGVPVVINGEHGVFQTKPHQILLQRFLSVLCTTTLSVSHAHKDKVVETLGISLKRIQVIHNGVDTEKFSGTCDTADLISHINRTNPGDIDETTFVIGCIGSVKPIKNQQLLVRAAAELSKRESGRKYCVLFVGQGPDIPMLQTLSQELGIAPHVIFLGERTDIPVLLSLMDALVLPSKTGKEGLPNVVLEALSSGVPVISTQSTGTHEVMIENETGWFLSAEDPVELSGRIGELMRDQAKCAEMGATARRHILENFSMHSMVGNYEEMYRRYLEHNS